MRRVGTTGHEIRDADGTVIAWTIDGYWAAILTALLNTSEEDRPGRRLIGDVVPEYSPP